MLEKYASIYNKNGRIGIYTKDVSVNAQMTFLFFNAYQQERSTIIRRFHEKRKRRVWKKKIRYHCRKNLADSRIRVKGRFVKSALREGKSSIDGTQEKAARHTMNALLLASQLESEESGMWYFACTITLILIVLNLFCCAESVGDDMEEGGGEDETRERDGEEEDTYEQESLRSTPTSASGRPKRMRRHSIAY
jgi:hypothetical protein